MQTTEFSNAGWENRTPTSTAAWSYREFSLPSGDICIAHRVALYVWCTQAPARQLHVQCVGALRVYIIAANHYHLALTVLKRYGFSYANGCFLNLKTPITMTSTSLLGAKRNPLKVTS